MRCIRVEFSGTRGKCVVRVQRLGTREQSMAATEALDGTREEAIVEQRDE